MTGKATRRIGSALVALSAIAAVSATPAAAGGSFPAAVETILMNQKQGHISKLGIERKRALITCVNQVLSEMPNGMKRYVLAATSYDEMEGRFGKVVMENRAEWKQKIARGCAHIAV